MSIPKDVAPLRLGNLIMKVSTQSLVVLLSAVTVCEEGGEPSGLNHHRPVTMKLKGKSLPLSSDPWEPVRIPTCPQLSP